MKPFDLTDVYVPALGGRPFILTFGEQGHCQPLFAGEEAARLFLADPVVRPLTLKLTPAAPVVLRQPATPFLLFCLQRGLRPALNVVVINRFRFAFDPVVRRGETFYYDTPTEVRGL